MFDAEKHSPNTELISGQEELIRKLHLQLNKDLKVEIFQFPEKDFEKIAALIEAILIEKQNELARILYQIDIDERLIQGLDDFKTLSYIILEREAKKVLFREQYKNG